MPHSNNVVVWTLKQAGVIPVAAASLRVWLWKLKPKSDVYDPKNSPDSPVGRIYRNQKWQLERSMCVIFWLLMLPTVKCHCNKPKPFSAVCVLTQAQCQSPGCQSKAPHKLLWQTCHKHLRVTKRVDSARHFAFLHQFISTRRFLCDISLFWELTTNGANC